MNNTTFQSLGAHTAAITEDKGVRGALAVLPLPVPAWLHRARQFIPG